MRIFRRLCSLVLVLSILLSTGVLEAIALSEELKDVNLPLHNTTGEIADVSDLFVISETEPESTDVVEKEELKPVVLQPVNAEAAVTGESQGFAYKVLEDGTCQITGYTGDVWEGLVIPENLDGYTVTAIGNYAFEKSSLISVTLPDSVTSIGNYAFQKCGSLASINLGASLTSIGAYAFDGCGGLTGLVIPNTVAFMGNGAFQNCVALTSITYPASLNEVGYGFRSGIFSGCTALETVEIPEGVTTLPTHVFGYAEHLKSVKLPSTLTSIGNHTFAYSGITTIDLPDGVISIGDYAFQGCVALGSIELGESLVSIGSFAFDSCTALTVMDLPDTVETIGGNAFTDCTALTSFTYPQNLKNVGYGYLHGVFTGCTALESIEVPEGVAVLPDYAFYYATSLKSVKLPSSLTTIGNHAFDHGGITSMDLPDGVTSIGDYAFQNCTAMETVELGESLTTIGKTAFARCAGLTEMDLPDTVETIGGNAFTDCTALTSFTYPKNLKNVGQGYLSGIITGCTGLESIEVPEGVTALPAYVFYYAKDLKSVKLPSTLTTIGNYAYMACTMDTITLPEGVESIGNSAFENCVNLENIQVGSSLTSIGTNAFSGCTALTKIELPDTVETIGTGAFTNCEKLESFTYPVSLKTISANLLDDGIFSGCTILDYVEVPEGVTALPDNVFASAEALKFVSLPSTLTSVGNYAFRDSGVVALILPDGVQTIGSSAFDGCTGLQTAHLGNSLTSIGTNAFDGCSALTSVDLPETLRDIYSGAFKGCTGLKTIDVPNMVENLGGAAFQDCTGLESIVLSDNITYMQTFTFSGCSSLRSVHLPRKLRQITGYAFANCTSLNKLFIPNSVTQIANYAFEGITDMTFECDIRSSAAEYAMDHQFAVIPYTSSEETFDTSLNTENSYYIHNYDGLSAAGVMSMVAHYELKENAGIKPKEITIHVYDFASLQEDTLTLDGKLCKNYTYDETTGRLTVPVEAASGTLRFCMKPLRYEALTSYARLVYTDGSGHEQVEIIGAVNSLMPALNISARGETSLSTVHVNGLAVPETEVSLYLDGVHVKTVKSNKAGDYAADISLGSSVDGKEYIITAEAADRNGNLVVAQANVFYRYTAPELQDFVMIYDAHRTNRISLMELRDMRPVLTFNPNIPFRFEVKFTNAEALSDVYVVSNRNNDKKYLKAYWDKDLGVFVAEGYFDPNNHSYVPGVLSLEYITGGEKISFTQEVDFSSQEAIDALPQVWKDADIEILKNTEQEVSLSITAGYGEDQISFNLSINRNKIPDHITEENVEELGFEKEIDDFGNVVYTRARGGAGSGGGGGDGRGAPPQFEVLDFAADEFTDYCIDEIQDAAGDFLVEQGLGPVGDALEIVFTIQDGIGNGIEIEELRDVCTNNRNLTAEQKQEFNDMAAEAHFVNVFGSVVQCALAGASIYAAIAFPPALPILAVGSTAVGQIFDLGMKLRMWNLTAAAYGLDIRFKWVVDPSGYVYDETTGERLEGVTVHAYWVEYTEEDTDFWEDKPGEDEYGVLWGSAEYSQMNPLVTDTEGRYAWDVPEGWWRVSYEKEGYESVWSQWLPVPPPQTEVNIGMKPLAAAHTHTEVTIPGKAATCTQDGLSEGKKCVECGEVLVTQVVILALGHNVVSHSAKAATCTQKGWKAYESCFRCDYTTYQAIAATGHKYDDNVDGTCNVCNVHREEVETRVVVHMFRMYNPNTGEHFYTGSEEERDNLIAVGWQYEGVGFTFPANTGAPVYRLFQPSTGEHLYTMSEAEKDKLMAEGWNYEGIAFNSAYDTEAVQHRLHNPNATVGAYHFTFSQEEKDTLIRLGWEYQGIGWYSCWK